MWRWYYLQRYGHCDTSQWPYLGTMHGVLLVICDTWVSPGSLLYCLRCSVATKHCLRALLVGAWDSRGAAGGNSTSKLKGVVTHCKGCCRWWEVLWNHSRLKKATCWKKLSAVCWKLQSSLRHRPSFHTGSHCPLQWRQLLAHLPAPCK